MQTIFPDNAMLVLLLAFSQLGFVFAFCKFSPASKSTKAWMALYITILAYYAYDHKTCKAFLLNAKDYVINHPAEAALIAAAIGAPLKYVQRKLRFARINAIKWKFGFTDDPSTWENMTIEQAQEIEQNMAEVCRPSYSFIPVSL
jgi:hypothetical protein